MTSVPQHTATAQEPQRQRRRAVIDRDHMVSIGRKGGSTTARHRDHMVSIGRKGGRTTAALYGREHMARLGAMGGFRSGISKRQRREVEENAG